MRNNENGNSRSGRSAAAVRLVLLALIFVTVFAVVLSCGTGTEAPLFGSVTDNVAEAAGKDTFRGERNLHQDFISVRSPFQRLHQLVPYGRYG